MAAVLIPDLPAAERWYRRHAGLVRITHWINVVCFSLLLMSRLQIFNAHPALYVGDHSDFDHPTMSILAHESERGMVGETVILGHSFDTTGVLGASSEDGQIAQRAFPSWINTFVARRISQGQRSCRPGDQIYWFAAVFGLRALYTAPKPGADDKQTIGRPDGPMTATA